MHKWAWRHKHIHWHTNTHIWPNTQTKSNWHGTHAHSQIQTCTQAHLLHMIKQTRRTLHIYTHSKHKLRYGHTHTQTHTHHSSHSTFTYTYNKRSTNVNTQTSTNSLIRTHTRTYNTESPTKRRTQEHKNVHTPRHGLAHTRHALKHKYSTQ